MKKQKQYTKVDAINTIDAVNDRYDSSITTLFLRRGKSESLKRFDPRVFSGAIAGANG